LFIQVSGEDQADDDEFRDKPQAQRPPRTLGSGKLPRRVPPWPTPHPPDHRVRQRGRHPRSTGRYGAGCCRRSCQGWGVAGFSPAPSRVW